MPNYLVAVPVTFYKTVSFVIAADFPEQAIAEVVGWIKEDPSEATAESIFDDYAIEDGTAESTNRKEDWDARY